LKNRFKRTEWPNFDRIGALYISDVAFAFIFGGALFGMLLRFVLPEPHLNSDTKDVVRLGTGLVATLAALVLGLLIASAQASFQTQSSQIRQITANVILLDNILARSGPQAEPVRVLLRSSVKTLVARIWREQDSAATKLVPFEASAQADLFFDKLLELTPQNDAQRQMQGRAVQIAIDLAQTRVLFAESDSAVPKPFVAVLVFWLTIIFVSFGIFARPNLTIVASLFVCALSASSAIFLILELNHPFSGLMTISNTPLSNALAPLSP
jgi:Protein of unknown function (DUF4239)